MLNKLVRSGTGLTGFSLLFLGLHCFLMPEVAAQGFGVPAGGDAGPWMQATGMRDVALGVALLGMLWKHPAAIPWMLGCVMTLPVADAVIVVASGAPLESAATHVVGGTGLAGLLLLSILNQRSTQAQSS